MEYFATTSAASRRPAGCVVVGAYERGKTTAAAAEIDSASGGLISGLIKSGDISGKPGSALLLSGVDGVRTQRVVVVGLGKVGKFGIDRLRQATTAAVPEAEMASVTELPYVPLTLCETKVQVRCEMLDVGDLGISHL